MPAFYNKQRKYLLFQLVLILFIVLLCFFAAGFPTVSVLAWVLFACSLLISFTGLIRGLLSSLGASLIVLFLFGSTIIWSLFGSFSLDLSVSEIILWMAAFPAAAAIPGLLHRHVTLIMEENKEMSEKFNDLVTIDEVSGLDNQKRFFFDLEEEFSRSRRTGIPFSLLLVEVKYMDQFKALYGEREADFLIQSMSEIIRKNTRITDRKFRIQEGRFAIILNNSIDENAEIVMRKLEKLLQNHSLENKKKQITLSIAFGLTGFREDVSDYMEMVENANQELSQYIQ